MYEILGLEPTDDTSKIKSAYRALARKYHPDLNDGNELFAAKFKEISLAYEILTDKDKKSGYAPMSFIVRKYFIDNSDNYVSGTFFIKHDEPVLLRLCSSFIDKGLYSNEFFTDFFVSVPHPFRNGDIVRTIEVCKKEYLGVS